MVRSLHAIAVSVTIALVFPSRANADVCGAGITTFSVNTATTDTCNLATAEGVTVNGGVTLSFTAQTQPFEIDSASAAILNNGVITTTGAGQAAFTFPGFPPGDPSSLSGGFTNNGTITTDTDGLAGFSSSPGFVLNSGSITSTGSYVIDFFQSDFSDPTGITNSGTMEVQSGNAVLRFRNVFVANGLTNTASGSIDGSGTTPYGIEMETLGVNVTNAGSISAATDGIRITGATPVITNQATGSITAANAINVTDASAATINNSGLLDGNVVLGGSTLNAIGAASRITGAITGGGASTFDLASGAEFTTEGTISVGTTTIASGATLNLRHTLTTSGGAAVSGTVDVARTAAVVNGNMDLTSGTLGLGVRSFADAGSLAVGGTLTLSNSTLIVDAAGLSGTGTLSNVLTAGTLSGTFGTINDTSALLDFTPAYGANSVDLSVSMVSLSSVLDPDDPVGRDGRIGPVFLAANVTGEAKTAQDTIFGLTTGDEVRTGLNQLLPISTRATVLSMSNLPRVMQSVAVSRLQSAAAPPALQLSAAPVLSFAAADTLPASDPRVFVEAFGSTATSDARDGFEGSDFGGGGLVLGVEGTWNGGADVGLALGIGRSSTQSDNRITELDEEGIGVTAFTGFEIAPATRLGLTLGLANHDFESSRDIGLGTGAIARADYDGRSFYTGANIAWTRAWREVTLTPRLSAEYLYLEANEYTETGAGSAGLSVADMTDEQLVLGASLAGEFRPEPFTKITGELGLEADILDGEDTVNASFQQGGPSFLFDTQADDGLKLVGALGLEKHLGAASALRAGYRFSGNADSRSHTAWIRLEVDF